MGRAHSADDPLPAARTLSQNSPGRVDVAAGRRSPGVGSPDKGTPGKIDPGRYCPAASAWHCVA